MNDNMSINEAMAKAIAIAKTQAENPLGAFQTDALTNAQAALFRQLVFKFAGVELTPTIKALLSDAALCGNNSALRQQIWRKAKQPANGVSVEDLV